jgi:hypothetical protein
LHMWGRRTGGGQWQYGWEAMVWLARGASRQSAGPSACGQLLEITCGLQKMEFYHVLPWLSCRLFTGQFSCFFFQSPPNLSKKAYLLLLLYSLFFFLSWTCTGILSLTWNSNFVCSIGNHVKCRFLAL